MNSNIKIHRALGQMNHAELKEVLDATGITTEETTKANIVKVLEASDFTFEVEVQNEEKPKPKTENVKETLTAIKHVEGQKRSFTYVRVLNKNGTISHYENTSGKKLTDDELVFTVVRKKQK